MTSNLQVLPCPFCGSPAREAPRWPKHYGCSNEECGALHASLTAEQWNMRPITGETPAEPYASAIRGLDTLLRVAVSHIDMPALEISHHTHWALLVQFAGPAPKAPPPLCAGCTPFQHPNGPIDHEPGCTVIAITATTEPEQAKTP